MIVSIESIECCWFEYVYENVTWLFWLKVLNARDLNNVYVNVTWFFRLKVLNARDLGGVYLNVTG
jgi:hypothetical protein